MADNKINLPGSGGGLVRYFDDYKSKIEIKPTTVIIAIAIVIAVEIFLYKFVGF